MNNVLLSIIIPTKNRYTSLIPILESISTIVKKSDIEFLVQDSSADNCEFENWFVNCNDKRIKYFYNKHNADVVSNFNAGIQNSSGEYCIMIGDDDLVNPYISEIMDIIVENNVSCLIYPRANYYWGNVVFFKEFDFFRRSSVQVIKNEDLNLCILNSKEVLESVLSRGGTYLFNLPALYHGIVKKSILDSIYSKYGSYILGPSPDMSLAVSLALEMDRYHYINFPVSITGASFNSAAGMGRRGEHSSKLEEMPSWIPQETFLKWNKEVIPPIWNGFTIYAQSIYMVCLKYGVDFKLSYVKLYDKILYENFKDLKYLQECPMYKKMSFLEKYKIILKNYFVFNARHFILLLPVFIINLLIHCKKYFRSQEHIDCVYTVQDCMELFKSKYSSNFHNKQ